MVAPWMPYFPQPRCLPERDTWRVTFLEANLVLYYQSEWQGRRERRRTGTTTSSLSEQPKVGDGRVCSVAHVSVPGELLPA
jgi:hypothetical protein